MQRWGIELLKLKVIIATTRPTRAADRVAPWVVRSATEHGAFDVEVLDLRDWPLPIFQEHLGTIGDFSDLSANGGWVTTNNLAFTYAPPQGLTGQDRFACIVADGRGGECVGVIIINFRPTNSLNINMSAGESTGAKLTMAGIPNRVYQIQASTNLVVWTTLSTVTADPAGIIEFLDAAAKDYPHRFYRAVAQ